MIGAWNHSLKVETLAPSHRPALQEWIFANQAEFVPRLSCLQFHGNHHRLDQGAITNKPMRRVNQPHQTVAVSHSLSFLSTKPQSHQTHHEADDRHEVDVRPGPRPGIDGDNEASEGRETGQGHGEEEVDGDGVERDGAEDGQEVDSGLDLHVRDVVGLDQLRGLLLGLFDLHDVILLLAQVVLNSQKTYQTFYEDTIGS